jgi:thiamine pyrophosphate-dependent acetolactate synthase large subunit-like protein
VYIEVPQDVMLEKRDFPPLRRPEHYRLPPQGAPQAAVEAAADALRAAKLPILVAGTAIHTARAHGAFRQLAELLQCPVVPTFGGRGVLPETHPQVLLAAGPGALACQETDCVLAIGTSVGETISFGGPPQFGPKDAQRWILVDRDPTAFGVNREIDIPVLGDLRAVLPQLVQALEKRGPFRPPARLAAWRAQEREFRRTLAGVAGDTVPIHPGRAIIEVRAVIPEDAVIVRDGGCTGIWDAVFDEQRSTDFLWTSKFGHLGTGLPYALAAQIAVGPGRRVCLVTGDSAFGFYMMELETAVRHQLPVLVVVNYDQHWGMEHAGQLSEIGHLVECQTTPIRLDQVARGLGAHGEYCVRTSEIRPAVKRGLASGKPAVVQVVTDAHVNAYDPPGFEQFAAWYEGNY